MAEEKINMSGLFHQIKIRISLIKLSISIMSSITAIAGFSMRLPVLSEGAFSAAAGVFFLAAGSSVMNNFQDRYTDTLMYRTKTRPIPSGSVTGFSAVIQSVLMIAAGLTVLILNSGSLLPAAAGIIAVIFYNGFYTHFRKFTILSFFSGIICGMLPPLIGWFSAGGTILTTQIIYFMALIGVWQVPHTWLIQLRFRNDYKRAGLITVIDFFSVNIMKMMLFLWVLFFATLTLFAKIFFNSLDFFFAILLIVNAIFLVLIFFNGLIIKKGNGEYASLFHLLNFSMMGVTLITINYSSIH